MKLQWTHAELLTALVAPARRATDGVARALGLRAEGADDSIGAEADPPLTAPPLRPDPAWANAARALVRPGWAAPNKLRRDEPLGDASSLSQADPAASEKNPGVSAALRRAATPPRPAPFEPLGETTASQASPISASLGFEPLNHPLLREPPRAERAVYELGAAPARAAWAATEPAPFDHQALQAPPSQAPASLEFEPSLRPDGAPVGQSPRTSAPSAQPPASLEFEPSAASERATHTAAALTPPEQPPASLEFEPSAAPDRVTHTAAALAPAAPSTELPDMTDLERLGDAFSDPFVAWRPGGAPAATKATTTPDDAPLPAHTTRLALHPAPRTELPPPSTMELQGAEAPRPVRLRDLGRAASTPSRTTSSTAARATAQRAPLDELFDDTPPDLEALPEGPAFTSGHAAPKRPAPSHSPAPAASPSPARLRPAMAEAFEPEVPATTTTATPSTPQAPQAAPGLPATPRTPTAAPQAAAGLDRDALEEAMTEVLRDAARQHGLEV